MDCTGCDPAGPPSCLPRNRRASRPSSSSHSAWQTLRPQSVGGGRLCGTPPPCSVPCPPCHPVASSPSHRGPSAATSSSTAPARLVARRCPRRTGPAGPACTAIRPVDSGRIAGDADTVSAGSSNETAPPHVHPPMIAAMRCAIAPTSGPGSPTIATDDSRCAAPSPGPPSTTPRPTTSSCPNTPGRVRSVAR